MPERLQLLAGLLNADDRTERAGQLAKSLDARSLLVFLRDPDLGIMLPAPGFPKTLHSAGEWRAFLEECVSKGYFEDHMQCSLGDEAVCVCGAAGSQDSVIVLVGGAPDRAGLQSLAPALPLLAHALVRERNAEIAAANAAIDRAVVADAKAAMDALSTAHHQLESAYRDIEHLNERLRNSMAEAHHRIKNNLQIIAAMIDMQLMDAASGPDSSARTVSADAVLDIAQHVRSLAVIHDLLTHVAGELTEGADWDEVDAKAALDLLVPLLRPSLKGRGLTHMCDSMPVTVKQVTAICIIVNELVNNAAKHGRGNVNVRLFEEGDACRLTVSDEGPGFPPDFDPIVSAHIGLDLVDRLCRWDLRGTVSYGTGAAAGSLVEIRFSR